MSSERAAQFNRRANRFVQEKLRGMVSDPSAINTDLANKVLPNWLENPAFVRDLQADTQMNQIKIQDTEPFNRANLVQQALVVVLSILMS